MIPLNHQYFVITSQYTLSELFHDMDPVLCEALHRRFKTMVYFGPDKLKAEHDYHKHIRIYHPGILPFLLPEEFSIKEKIMNMSAHNVIQKIDFDFRPKPFVPEEEEAVNAMNIENIIPEDVNMRQGGEMEEEITYTKYTN